MTRFLLAAAVAGLSAAGAAAQTPVTTVSPPVTGTVIPGPVAGGSPVVIGSTGVIPSGEVITGSTGTARRGLFGRVRVVRGSTPVTNTLPMAGSPLMTPSPVITGSGLGAMPAMTVTPQTSAPGAVVPNQMPPIAPAPRGGTSMMIPGSMPAVTGSGIVLAGGTADGIVMPAGGVVTTGGTGMPGTVMSGTVMPAGGVVTTGGTVMPAGTVVMSSPGLGITTSSGAVIPGSVAMPSGSVVTVGNTMTMPTGSTLTPVMVTSPGGNQRMGLIARIRARR